MIIAMGVGNCEEMMEAAGYICLLYIFIEGETCAGSMDI